MIAIKQIVALQELDSELKDIAELLGDLPIKVEALIDNEEAFIKSLKDGKVRAKELELELSKLEGQMTDFKEKINKHKDQLFLVTNNKQYDALQNEIDHLKSQLDESETASLEFSEEKELLEQKIIKEEKNLESLSVDLIERRKKLEVLIEESSTKKEKLEEGRDEQRSSMDLSIITKYDRIANAREGLTVVSVGGNACGGCGAFIPPQIISEVRAYKGPHTCDSCSRFLNWDSE